MFELPSSYRALFPASDLYNPLPPSRRSPLDAAMALADVTTGTDSFNKHKLICRLATHPSRLGTTELIIPSLSATPRPTLAALGSSGVGPDVMSPHTAHMHNPAASDPPHPIRRTPDSS